MDFFETQCRINGKHGDEEICAEFTEQFQSAFRPNTVNSDAKYELELQDLWRSLL